MVLPFCLSLEQLGYVSQAGETCKPGEHPCRELLPSIEAVILTRTLVVVSFHPVEKGLPTN
jgi:hypothetical protein